MFSQPKVPPPPKPPPPPPSLGDPNVFRVGTFQRLAARNSGFQSTVAGGSSIFKAMGGTARPMTPRGSFAVRG